MAARGHATSLGEFARRTAAALGERLGTALIGFPRKPRRCRERGQGLRRGPQPHPGTAHRAGRPRRRIRTERPARSPLPYTCQARVTDSQRWPIRAQAAARPARTSAQVTISESAAAPGTPCSAITARPHSEGRAVSLYSWRSAQDGSRCAARFVLLTSRFSRPNWRVTLFASSRGAATSSNHRVRPGHAANGCDTDHPETQQSLRA